MCVLGVGLSFSYVESKKKKKQPKFWMTVGPCYLRNNYTIYPNFSLISCRIFS